MSEASSSATTLASVQAYLTNKGYARALSSLNAEAAGAGAAGSTSLSVDDLASKNAPRDHLGTTTTNSSSGVATPNEVNGNKGRGNETSGVEEKRAALALRQDVTDVERGFTMIRNWIEGSLDIYLPELRPLLLPLFIHAFIGLIEGGHGTAAAALYAKHSNAFLPTHLALLSHIRSLALPSHVAADELSRRFRTERYVLKMSATVFGLLLGWLTDGGGPVAGAGAAQGVGEGVARVEERARIAMLKIINERCRVQVLHTKPQELTSALLEEGTGLTGAGPAFSPFEAVPRSLLSSRLAAPAAASTDVVADFNAAAAGPQLKLGPTLPMSERLAAEVEREVKAEVKREEEAKAQAEEAKRVAEGGEVTVSSEQAADADAMQGVETTGGDATAAAPSTQGVDQKMKESTPSARGTTAARQTSTPARGSTAIAATPAPAASAAQRNAATASAPRGLLQPEYEDLPPQVPLFRSVDIEREVARVRDARKALRFNLASGPLGLGEGAAAAEGSARTAALPSVCAYTYHDADDGLCCSTFSPDVTMMAAGFEESYVQVWSLKGEPLQGLRNDLNLSNIRDANSLNQQRERTTSTTRKLIGHSGPVYGVSFDPVAGTSGPARHLLSSSADGTARLWSLDTFSALVAYRGHQQPVWDVEWGPLGLYFATASADRTARLWSTERINPLRIYAGHLSDVDCLRFHPNSLYLATGSSDRTCRLWDVQRGACVRLFVGHQSAISTVRISPDGRYLASAGCGNAPFRRDAPRPTPEEAATSDEGAISLWDLASGKRVKKMWGHAGRVHDLDFSTDGALLVSTGEDCTVKCWDVRGAGGVRRAPVPGSLEAQQIAAAVAEKANVAGGAMDASNAALAAMQDANSSADCLASFATKNTPMIDVHVTPRNLVLCAGAWDAAI